jgi:hypothetical protein
VADYLKAEYERRCRRHAFYEDLGYGGKQVVMLSRFAADALHKPTAPHTRARA